MQAARSATLSSKAVEALTCFACVGIYALVLILLMRDYASIEWWVYGFSYAPPTKVEIFLLILYLFITVTFIPIKVSSPSSLILIIVYLLVIVPAGVSVAALALQRVDNNYMLLVAMGGSFVIACLMNRNDTDALGPPERYPHPLLVPVLIVVAGFVLAFLTFRYREVMSFASLDELYEQRERGSAGNLFEGYAQTYSQYVFSTGLLAFGLVRRNLLLIGFGLIGSLINFMITAEKAGFMYPIFIISLFFIIKSGKAFARDIRPISLAFSVILFVSLQLYHINYAAEFISWYFGIRTILVPGSFTLHYLDFFSFRGFTWFSHVRGIDLLLGIPPEFAADRRWPAIGLIVGEDYFNYRGLNASANFIAWDGAASLGILGMFVITIVFGFLLKVLDRVSAGIGPLPLLILMPIGMTLTNGSLFTMLTSFGGILWIALFHFSFSREHRPRGAVAIGETVRDPDATRPMPGELRRTNS